MMWSRYFGKHNSTHSFIADPVNRSFCTPCEIQNPESAHVGCTCLTQDQNVPTLWQHMAPVDAEAEVLGVVLEAIKKPNGKIGVSAPGRITTGLVGTHLILPLLSRHNHSDLALQLAMGTELPSWGYQITRGATTLWESCACNDSTSFFVLWNVFCKEPVGLIYMVWLACAGSGEPDLSLGQPPTHNHHFLGGCVQWFHDSLVGLSQGNGSAFSDMLIAPDIVTSADLPSMEGVYDLPRGRVRVAWEVSVEQGFTLNVVLPANTRATILVPGGPKQHCTRNAFQLFEGLTPVWEAGKSASNVPASMLHVECRQDGRLALRVGSGSYNFRVAQWG
jgi:hypothetical protein